MADEGSIDLTGVGKLAQAIPASAWSEIVHTACDSFSKFLAPIIETTSGIGRLIGAKFDRFVDAEKVLAADLAMKASQKARGRRSRSKQSVQASIILVALEHGATQTDQTLRELWANLLAQELVTGGVHPEFPTILSKLSAKEALILAQIAQSYKVELSVSVGSGFMRAFFSPLILALAEVSMRDLIGKTHEFEHEHLRLLNLIERRDGTWRLTLIGKAFIGAVSDPSFRSKGAEAEITANPGHQADG